MKIYTHDELPQGSDEWLKVRLGKFGSTDAQAVATNGKGLETKCFEKAAEVLTGKLPKQFTNEDIERGNRLESMARSAYEIETGRSVDQVGYVELSERVGGSPDGLVEDKGMVEIKCPSDANFLRFLVDKKIDTKYVWQMQHLLYITNRNWCDFIMFNENLDRIYIQRVTRDAAACKKIEIGLKAGERRIEEILGKVSK